MNFIGSGDITSQKYTCLENLGRWKFNCLSFETNFYDAWGEGGKDRGSVKRNLYELEKNGQV